MTNNCSETGLHKPCALLLGILLLLSGCSSFPPPEIRNGQFIYPEWELSFEVPPSPPWQPAKYLPMKFLPRTHETEFIPGRFAEAVFVHEGQNSAITLETRKDYRNLGAYSHQQIQALIRKDLHLNARVANRTPFVSDYQFKMPAWEISEHPQTIAQQFCTLHNAGEQYRYESRIIAFIIGEDDTCLLRFTFWSEPSTYESNRAVLDKMVASLKHIPPATP